MATASPARAEIDTIVSKGAWARFPALLESVDRWADLAGYEGKALVISAYAIPHEYQWISIRVTRVSPDGRDVDWIEWIVETSFALASASAIDHFVAREMQMAAARLTTRTGTGFRGRSMPVPGSPNHVPFPSAPTKNGAVNVAKVKATAKVETGRGVPATKTRAKPTAPAPAPKAPAPTKVKVAAPAKRGRKPKAPTPAPIPPTTARTKSTRAVETRAAVPAKPGRKPKATAPEPIPPTSARTKATRPIETRTLAPAKPGRKPKLAVEPAPVAAKPGRPKRST